jgi:hypothetical protein
MSGFANSVVGGGGDLIRESIHSPGYMPGISGWSINRDDSAEFNDLTARGTVEVGPDDSFQIVIRTDSGAGLIEIYTHAATEGSPGNIRAQVGNAGAANEYLRTQVQSPRHPNGTADDYILLSLNSQNADNTSRANLQIARADGSGGPIDLIASFDENNIFLESDVWLSGNLNGWGTWTPTWAGIGTATFTTNTGYYKNFGDIYWFALNATVNANGSGAGVVTFTLPATPHRGLSQIFPLFFAAGGATSYRTGYAFVFTSGSGTAIDQIRVQNGGATNNLVNMVGTDLTTGRSITVQGWFRKA